MMKHPQKDHYFTRKFHAAPETVFKAWTDEKLLAEWWGPIDFTNPVCKLNLVPGGEMYIEMTAPDGTKFPMGGSYLVIDPPSHLLFSSTAFPGADGESGLEVNSTVIFEEDENGSTVLQLHVQVTKVASDAHQSVEGMAEGWKQSFEKLELLLERIR